MSIKSNFEQNITNQLERLKEIISTPVKFKANYENGNVQRIHDSIRKELKEYTELSIDRIKKDVYNLVLPTLDKYDVNKVKQDIKSHVFKKNNDIGELNEVNYELEFIDSEIYDDLHQNVDLSMNKDKLTNENKKMIKYYMKIKEEIEDEYHDLIENIKSYEQKMVNLRQKLLDECSNKVIPKLYKAHLSYIKNGQMVKKQGLTSTEEVYVDINNVQYPINQKQAIFFKDMLKKYLKIEV